MLKFCQCCWQTLIWIPLTSFSSNMNRFIKIFYSIFICTNLNVCLFLLKLWGHLVSVTCGISAYSNYTRTRNECFSDTDESTLDACWSFYFSSPQPLTATNATFRQKIYASFLPSSFVSSSQSLSTSHHTNAGFGRFVKSCYLCSLPKFGNVSWTPPLSHFVRNIISILIYIYFSKCTYKIYWKI